MNKLIAALTGKSKTVNINALMAAIVAISKSFGYEMSVETVTAFYTVLNIVLRFVTDKPLDEK
jgi:hypothetical protein